MAVEGPQPVKDSRRAAADLRLLQYHFVTYDAAGDVIATAAVGNRPAGVLQNTPNLGETAEIVVVGLTKVSADAALATPGTMIGPSADGQADAKAFDAIAVTDWYAGHTRGVAGGAGELVDCFVNCITCVPCGA